MVGSIDNEFLKAVTKVTTQNRLNGLYRASTVMGVQVTNVLQKVCLWLNSLNEFRDFKEEGPPCIFEP